MTRVLATTFLVAHGGVHAAIWMTPRLPDAPFDAAHSWLLGDVRPVTIALAAIAGLAFIVAGVGYFGGYEWWALAGTSGAVVSILLLVLTFTPWWLMALVINVALLIVAWPTLVDAVRP